MPIQAKTSGWCSVKDGHRRLCSSSCAYATVRSPLVFAPKYTIHTKRAPLHCSLTEDSIAIDISSRGHEHDPSAPAREENAPARQEDHGLQVDATAAAASDVGDGEAPARAPLKSDDEISRVEAAGLESNAEGAEVVFTPVRQAPVVVEEAEGDADSPATPTLAEWEISEVKTGRSCQLSSLGRTATSARLEQRPRFFL